MQRLSFTIFALAFLLNLAGCAGGGALGVCQSDQECPGGQVCLNNTCKCQSDDHCETGEICNSFGNCQTRPDCLGNNECEAGTICNSADPSGAKCIPESECGTSVHCDFNNYCQIAAGTTTGSCVPGCQDTGDCQLGYVCQNGTCLPGAVSTDCQKCPVYPTQDASYCEYGESCAPNGTCTDATAGGELCTRCEGSCSDPNLTCIIDREACSCIDSKCYPTDTPCNTADDCIGLDCSANYCAPVCDNLGDCPNGFDSCGGVSLVCGTCTQDADCANGGRCIKGGESDAGFCACTSQFDCDTVNSNICFPSFLGGNCSVGPPCETDTDCSGFGGTCVDAGFTGQKICNIPCQTSEDCICSNNTCLLTGLPCSSADDCKTEFRPLDDENPAGGGICETTVKVCGKAAGITCETVESGTALCQELN